MIRSNIPQEPLALWGSRLSLFALALMLVGLILHRLGVLATPVALTTAAVGFACAALGMVVATFAGISIWTRGRLGAGRVAVGLIGGGLLWVWPLAALPSLTTLPAINDIATDTADPPRFQALANLRPPGAKPAAYPGERTARAQQAAYPDLHTLVVNRSAEEVFEQARLTAEGRKGLGWKVVTRDPPQLRPQKPGYIEATSRTTIVGFIDDIVIRVSGNDSLAKVDIRSASRFGRHDLGANASRIRRFLRELQSRLDASTPGSVMRNRGGTAKLPLPAKSKRPLERTSETKGSKGGRAPAPQDARRGQGQKGQPRG